MQVAERRNDRKATAWLSDDLIGVSIDTVEEYKSTQAASIQTTKRS
jgi:hypothetical protein